MNAPNGSEEPIAVFLTRMSSYLDKLAGQVFDIEETIGQAVERDAVAEPPTITNLQALDFLRQSLEDLALMSTLLGNSAKGAINLAELDHLSRKLRLKATRSLLTGEEQKDFGANRQTIDDLDLF